MSNYIGAECPVCKEKFAENDDIVVCPVCGTPHHRQCYQKNGSCAFEQQHSSGHSWSAPKHEQPHSDGEIICSSCHSSNPANSIFCRSCGTALNFSGASAQPGAPWAGRGAVPNAFTLACGGLHPTEQIDGISARDLALYVGPNSHYYLPRFKAFSQQSSGLSFNLSALLGNFFYFFYRKMYLPGLLFLAAVFITYIPALLIMPQWAAYVVEHLPEMLAGVTPTDPLLLTEFQWVVNVLPIQRFIVMAISLACSLFGNQLYYRHVIRSIKRIKENCVGMSDEQYAQMLTKKGRTNMIIAIAIGIAIIALYFIITFIALSPYWDTVYSVVAGYVGAV